MAQVSCTNLCGIHDNGKIWLPRCQLLLLRSLERERSYKLYLCRILQQSAKVGTCSCLPCPKS